MSKCLAVDSTITFHSYSLRLGRTHGAALPCIRSSARGMICTPVTGRPHMHELSSQVSIPTHLSKCHPGHGDRRLVPAPSIGDTPNALREGVRPVLLEMRILRP